MRVEVDVVQDHHVGRGEVDAQPAGPRRQQEHEDAPVRVVLVDQLDAAGGGRQ